VKIDDNSKQIKDSELDIQNVETRRFNTSQISQVSQVSQVIQVNHVNQVNQVIQVNQVNQVSQVSQVSQMNQVKPNSRMKLPSLQSNLTENLKYEELSVKEQSEGKWLLIII
jgi:hypothetical protein